MIEFYNQKEGFTLAHTEEIKSWLEQVVSLEGLTLGDVSYVFCDDDYLLKINQDFLDHDYYTDIISFDYRLGNQINGEIYVSVDRVLENAQELDEKFEDELHRVLVHGILHFLGHKDTTEQEKKVMRERENKALELRNFI